MISQLASIPSPGSDALVLGPFTLRFYGLCIALGVIAAVWLAQRRWLARGGDPDDVTAVAMWAVPAGLIGSRIYHVITDWKRFDEDGWINAFKLWEGGLGIPGGMAAGIVVAIWVLRRRGLSVAEFADAATPALPLAQAIGRWGNWFNQELYGRPSDLPWAVEIDPDVVASHTPQYAAHTTFHPTFLYESLWNLALVGVLIWVDRKQWLNPGRLIAVYIAGYGLGRLWIEIIRVDTASLVLGVRINVWMSIGLIIGGVLGVVLGGIRSRTEPVEVGSD